MRKIVECLECLIGKENVKRKVNLKNYLTFKVDCIAKILIEIYSKKELVKVIDFLNGSGKKYYILGNGSNVLFKNKLVKDIVIHINSGYQKIYFKNGKYYLSAFAGCKVSSIIKKCKNRGFSCMEWAIGIPASIGGAVIMNMGSLDNVIGDKIYSVTYYENGTLKTVLNNKNLFSYRNSVFKNKNCVIINVVLILTRRKELEIQKDLTKYIKIKSSTQPLKYPSCGSIFKNGDSYKVAKLIQECNLKGCTIGGAQVSLKHSNFIINFNNATNRDIISLISYVKKEVYKKFRIDIEEEIVIF
ncbi:MAG: UDP-N-acetylmuramate dehydrogenase [Clostridia bacterium]|nr:UDP-N-acetylmuramate dehydrogenase [Clostridia bacterium]